MPLKEPLPFSERGGRLRLPLLYPILDAAFDIAWPPGPPVEALARAGCRLVQLRAKELTSLAYHDWALDAVERARYLGIRVLINDRADIALTTGAGGVHLGQEDLSPRSARRILGPDAVIGLSTHSVDQASAADALPVDYIAIGPVYPSATKPGGRVPLGPEGVAQVRQVVKKPLVAIGGITLENGGAVLRAGADSLAVISALLAAENVETTARWMMDRWRIATRGGSWG